MCIRDSCYIEHPTSTEFPHARDQRCRAPRREIYGKLRELTAKGYAVIILSSDVEEVAGISDRSLVLDRGRIVQEFPRGVTPAALMAATAETQTA